MIKDFVQRRQRHAEGRQGKCQTSTDGARPDV
jgi:hypothetical protein